MNTKTETKTTIETTAHFQDGGFKAPREKWYDGQEERFNDLDLNGELAKLDIPKGEYKITITLEKI